MLPFSLTRRCRPGPQVMRVEERWAIPIPDALSSASAAPLMCPPLHNSQALHASPQACPASQHTRVRGHYVGVNRLLSARVSLFVPSHPPPPHTPRSPRRACPLTRNTCAGVAAAQSTRRSGTTSRCVPVPARKITQCLRDAKSPSAATGTSVDIRVGIRIDTRVGAERA